MASETSESLQKACRKPAESRRLDSKLTVASSHVQTRAGEELHLRKRQRVSKPAAATRKPRPPKLGFKGVYAQLGRFRGRVRFQGRYLASPSETSAEAVARNLDMCVT